MSESAFTPVTLELPSLAPPLVLEILPSGLTLQRLYVQADGRTHDIIVGPEDPTDHAVNPYTNTIIGRYTNRLPVGTHTLKHSSTNTTNQFTVKANPISGSPNVQLHGGVEGYDKRVFAKLPVAETKLFSPGEKKAIESLAAVQIWTYTSPDGEEDFPGALRLEVLTALLPAPASEAKSPTATSPDAEYTLGSVLIVYRAALEQGASGPTPINLTQHWGFNLDASLNARKSKLERESASYGSQIDLVEDHTLRIAADGVLALDADNNSAGKLDDVTGTGHDFRTDKPIAKGIPARGYDDFYAFAKDNLSLASKHTLSAGSLSEVDEVTPLLREPGALGVPLVTLAGAKSGLTTQFWTNQAGVQFYTANFYDRSNGRKKIHGGSGVKGTGDGYGPRAAAFLEFHEPLAAFLDQNKDTVRSGYDTLLAPGEVYNNWVRMDVLCRSVPEESL